MFNLHLCILTQFQRLLVTCVPLSNPILKVVKVKHCAQSEVYAGYKLDEKLPN